MKTMRGFTLIEMMIALAIMTILMMMAMPSFSELIKNSRLTSQVNLFIASVNYARSEAIKRNQNVILCRSATGTACGGAGRWDSGWIIFVDNDTSGTLNGGDEVLKIFGALPGGNTLTATANLADTITYRPKGYVSLIGTLILCDDRNGDGDTNDAEDFKVGRAIIISKSGRARTDKASASSATTCGT